MAERNSSHKAHLLDEDIWVVATFGMLLDESEPFDKLMEHCTAIETRVNASPLEGN